MFQFSSGLNCIPDNQVKSSLTSFNKMSCAGFCTRLKRHLFLLSASSMTLFIIHNHKFKNNSSKKSTWLRNWKNHQWQDTLTWIFYIVIRNIDTHIHTYKHIYCFKISGTSTGLKIKISISLSVRTWPCCPLPWAPAEGRIPADRA